MRTVSTLTDQRRDLRIAESHICDAMAPLDRAVAEERDLWELLDLALRNLDEAAKRLNVAGE